MSRTMGDMSAMVTFEIGGRCLVVNVEEGRQ